MTKESNVLELISANKTKWLEELISMYKSNLWTECSFNEYCIFKAWSYFQGDAYFKKMQSIILKEEGKDLHLDTIIHDAWTLYKASIGVDTSDIIYKVIENSQKDLSNIIESLEGGVA